MIERKEAILFHTITKNNSNIIHNALCRSKKKCVYSTTTKIIELYSLLQNNKKKFQKQKSDKNRNGLDHNLKKAL